MKYIVTGKEMKRYDDTTINTFKVPAMVLMEQAAIAAANIIAERFDKTKTVCIMAGSGNNGGDGIALGRLLWQRGYAVTFHVLGKEEKWTKETTTQIEIIKKYSLSLQTNIPTVEYDIMIDALVGIGLTKDITGIYEDAICYMNQSNGIKISLDIPSGICADTGKVYHRAVQSDITITFSFEKRGHYLSPGNSYYKELITVPIGITKESFLGEAPTVFTYEKGEKKKLPKRDKNGHKGTFGKVLVVAGSCGMNGAAILCAKSAYRMGAGMVRIFTKEENAESIQKALPEVLITTYQNKTEIENALCMAMEWADVIAAGPGMGIKEETKMIMKLLVESNHPLLFDADALNCIAKEETLKERLKGKNVIITPHLAEFSRLCGESIKQIQEDRINRITEFAKKQELVVVCKDARTIVSNKGIETYINTSGNEGMATAGSGDVLCGIIAGLLAQGSKADEAAIMGTYIHGRAGDLVKEKMNSYSLMAGDIIEELKYMLGETEYEAL